MGSKIVSDEQIKALCVERGMTHMSEEEAFNLVVVYNNDPDTDFTYRAISGELGWIVAVYDENDEYMGAL
jgi:hypothetical protein